MSELVGIGLVSKALGMLKSVPWQVWAVIALLLLVKVGHCQHQKAVAAYGAERFEAGQTSLAEKIKKLQDEKEEADRKLAEELRRKVDEENRRIDSDAVRISLRGPGAARCPTPATTLASTSGHESASAEANAAGLGVPTDERAAVPWSWLVMRAVEHDKLLVEVSAWREQKAREIAAYNEGR